MERIPIRLKVAATLVLPLVMLLVVSVLEVRSAADDFAEVRTEAQLARSVTGPSGVITGIQDERNWAVLEMTGLDGEVGEIPVVGYDETRTATDDALRTFRTDVESRGGAVESTFRDSLDATSSLTDIRAEIDDFSADRTLDNVSFSSDIYDRYSALIDALLEDSAGIIGQVDDAELRQGARLAVLASQQVELDATLARVTLTTALVSPGGVDTREEVVNITSLLGRFERHNDQIEATTGPYADVVRDNYPAAYVEDILALTNTALETGTVEDFQVWLDVAGAEPDAAFPQLREAVYTEIVDRADQLTEEASTRQRVFVALAVVVLTVAAAVTLLVSRSITRPLRSLTRQADDIAHRRLPEAVREIRETPPGHDVLPAPVRPAEVSTNDEVADVADALNKVQGAAVGLAVEQAVLRRNVADSLVNLGRRSQNLLGRQLDFITELEAAEVDPETLAALYRLDHLATRMRRNAESLLVLAGVESPRQWAGPVPVAAVVRAALGEVEGYERVRLGRMAPATVQGTVVADLTHLLAELVENALAFSLTTHEVLVVGAWRESHSYRLSVADHGRGMSPEVLARANSRLAGTTAATIAPSSSLGHHVAGSLAARHGIRVWLDPDPVGGTIANVDLPGQVVAPTERRSQQPGSPPVLPTSRGGS